VRKKPSQYWKRTKGVYFRKSDLKAIVALLSARKGPGVRIDTDTHEVENVDELMISIDEPVADIDFVRSGGTYDGLLVNIDAESVRVTFVGDADENVGDAARLDVLISKRRQRLRYFVTIPLLYALIPLLGSFGARAALHGIPEWARVFFSVVVGFTLTAVWLMYDFSRKKPIKFRPELGERKPINWRSVGYAVALLIVGSVLTQVGTAIRESFRRDATPSVSTAAPSSPDAHE
jgi:hypothetical protein